MNLIDEMAKGIVVIGENTIDNKFVEGILAVGAVVVTTVLAVGEKKMLENSTLNDVGDIIKSSKSRIDFP